MDIKSLLELFRKSPELFLDTSGRSGAKTYCYQDYYLKIGKKHELEAEYRALIYFSKYNYSQAALEYSSSERDYLLTKRMSGMCSCAPKLISNPEILAVTLGKLLRKFHDTKFTEAISINHNEEILKRVFLNYQQANLDEQMTQGIGCLELDEVFSYINAKKDILVEDTVIHGDYCLLNIFLDQDYRFCGFLDMGRAGVGDRHYDLFWGRWSLAYNLGNDKYGDLFYEAYGNEVIDPERLKLIAYIACLDG